MRRAALIVCPSLITALLTTAVFFAIFDPVDLSVFWAPLGPSATGAYVEAYLLFWIFGAMTSAITLLLQGRAYDVAQDGGRFVRPKSRSRWYATDRRRA